MVEAVLCFFCVSGSINFEKKSTDAKRCGWNAEDGFYIWTKVKLKVKACFVEREF